MKPINGIVSSAAILLVIAGSAMVLGWTTQRKSFLMIGERVFLIAFVVSCLPLIALGAVGCWRKIKRLFE
jgi:hypothetical protein